MNDDFSLDQHAEDFYENGFEPNETPMNNQTLSQDEIAAHNMEFKLGGCYSQYAGEKSIGCVLYWIKVFCGLQYAERCCAGEEGCSVDLSPYTDSPIATSYHWVEDKPGTFRPRFEFAPRFDFAAKEQEIFEKYLLNK